MENYDHAGQTDKIIARTLEELGLDERYLKLRLGFPANAPVKWDGRSLSAFRWIQICDALHIPTDSISIGYNRRMHKARLAFDRRYGLVILTRTIKLKAMLHEIKCDQRDNWRWESQHYGFRLRWRIRRHRFQKLLRSLPMRWRNQLTLRHELTRSTILSSLKTAFRRVRENPYPTRPAETVASFPAPHALRSPDRSS